jgi:hypothetical protein
MQVACTKVPVWPHISAGVKIQAQNRALGPKVRKNSTLRQKLHEVTPKRAGVHVHDMKKHCTCTKSVLVSPKSGTEPKNWAQKCVKIPL